MKVELTDKLILTSDSHNFILNSKDVCEKGKKKGQAVLRPIGFYSSLSGAVQGCLKHKMRQSTATDLKTLLHEHTAFTTKIKSVFSE